MQGLGRLGSDRRLQLACPGGHLVVCARQPPLCDRGMADEIRLRDQRHLRGLAGRHRQPRVRRLEVLAGAHTVRRLVPVDDERGGDLCADLGVLRSQRLGAQGVLAHAGGVHRRGRRGVHLDTGPVGAGLFGGPAQPGVLVAVDRAGERGREARGQPDQQCERARGAGCGPQPGTDPGHAHPGPGPWLRPSGALCLTPPEEPHLTRPPHAAPAPDPPAAAPAPLSPGAGPVPPPPAVRPPA